jgi:hypothetical protein
MVDEGISPDEDLINPWRRAKGDLLVVVNGRGKVSHAIPSNLTIIKELIRREVLPYHYEIYGVGFLELQSAFRTPFRAKCSSVLLEQWGVGASAGRAAAIYLNVCRALGDKKISRIEFVLETRDRRVSKKKFAGDLRRERRTEDAITEFCGCFERLIELMDKEKEELKKETQVL